jgi:hypothetical protein
MYALIYIYIHTFTYIYIYVYIIVLYYTIVKLCINYILIYVNIC